MKEFKRTEDTPQKTPKLEYLKNIECNKEYEVTWCTATLYRDKISSTVDIVNSEGQQRCVILPRRYFKEMDARAHDPKFMTKVINHLIRIIVTPYITKAGYKTYIVNFIEVDKNGKKITNN